MKLLRKKQNRFLINIFSFIILSVFIFVINLPPKEEKIIDDPLNFTKKIRPNKQNPPPPMSSSESASDSLYIMIFDEEYSPKDFHCLTYNQWIESFRDYSFVDGVEIYSLNGWKHPNCNMQTVTVPSPPQKMKDPTSWQLYKSLELYLERSTSEWLFLVGDATYISSSRFLSFIKEIQRSGPHATVARGGCIEQRYFFQLLEISSGIIFSRTAVENILKLDLHWNTSFAMELRADEALGHAINNINLYVPNQVANGFVGNEFFDKNDFIILMNKDFDKLPTCKIRDELYNPFPGTQGNCVKHVQKFMEIFSWAGGGKKHKKEFLENAEEMLNGASSSVGLIWEKVKPRLCKL